MTRAEILEALVCERFTHLPETKTGNPDGPTAQWIARENGWARLRELRESTSCAARERTSTDPASVAS